MTDVRCWAARFGRRSFLLSTSAVVAFAAGMLVESSPPFAQESRSSDTTLPKVTVTAPTTTRRHRAAATAPRTVRPIRHVAASAPTPKKLPSVNSQDAKTGQSGYITQSITSATRTNTPLINVPQSVTVLTKEFIRDQAIMSIGEATRYVPGVIYQQGEGHRDDLIIRGQRTNADFFINGIRDDAQYFRDFYNAQRLEVLKGPNAMIFGRGGGGGVVNRVLKEADGTPVREFTVWGNSYPGARMTTDIGQAINENWAARFNAMYENTSSYRDFVHLDRWAVNPTVTFAPNDTTTVKLSYEHLHDRRTVDRGIPSQVRPGNALPRFPYETSASTYFGNPILSYSLADVDIGMAIIDHDFENGLTARNSTMAANYNKFYQNVFPGGGTNAGAVNVGGTSSNLSSYNQDSDRANLFNRTDLTYKFDAGLTRHTVLFGGELGRQSGLNYRQTGFFNGVSSTIAIDPNNPVSYVPMTFRNTATDADNIYNLNLGAAFVQDQIEITRYLQLIGGVRFDHFDLQSRDRRTSVVLGRVDDLVSPRMGVVYKPIDNLSIYGSYSVSYLPSAGDQFSLLNPGLVIAKPEKFVNTEIGVKYDILPRLQFAAAVYDLDRTNQRVADPNNAGFFLLNGATRTRGFEASLAGYITDAWQINAGYAYTDARIVNNLSGTIVAGNRVDLVPYNTFSIWNKYQFNPMWAGGLGVIHYSSFFASADNTVRIPGFTRVDGAIIVNLNETWRAQLNIENLFDQRYYSTAHNNNNIMPGSPRVFRMSATAKF